MQRVLRVALPLAFVAVCFLFLPVRSHAATVTVSMGPNYFAASQVTINAGDTVVWRNTDTMAHNVTSNDGSFVSQTLQPGAEYAHTFAAAGSYAYRCTFHPGMTGTIT